MHFPKGLHLRLRWQCLSRLQFKAEGPDFQAELIPVHSPLLRESCLVSYPPLTYMLKFSGFADLASCLELKMKTIYAGKLGLRSRKAEEAGETHPIHCEAGQSSHTWASCVKLGKRQRKTHGATHTTPRRHTQPTTHLTRRRRGREVSERRRRCVTHIG